MKDPKELTWEELVALPETYNKPLYDQFEDGIRFIILKGPAALCAYIGIPAEHPLAGFDYDDIPVSAHGGLTFAGKGDGLRPKGYYWYGWDYAHSGDYCFYYDKDASAEYRRVMRNDKKWLVKDVISDAWSTLYDFKKLVKISEKIAIKTK